MKKTTLCYLEHNDCYLMMLRNKKDHDQSEGKWLGIGGKFLPGESPEACLAREVKEETGFTLGDPHFRGVVHFLSDVWDDEDMYLYTAKHFSWEDAGGMTRGEAVSSDELGESAPPVPPCNEGTLAWIPKSQVLDLNLWEGDHLFLERLLAGEDFGELTVRYEGDTLVATS